MKILKRSRTKRIRITAAELADGLANRLRDLDGTRDQAAGAVHDATDSARHGIERAAEIARGFKDDIAAAGDRAQADVPVDEIVQRIRAASAPAIRALATRLERDDPGGELGAGRSTGGAGRKAKGKARATAADAAADGRTGTRSRSKVLLVGLVAVIGIGAGFLAAALLDPRRGKQRRATIAGKARRLAGQHADGTPVASDLGERLAAEPPTGEPLAAETLAAAEPPNDGHLDVAPDTLAPPAAQR